MTTKATRYYFDLNRGKNSYTQAEYYNLFGIMQSELEYVDEKLQRSEFRHSITIAIFTIGWVIALIASVT